MNAPGKLNPIQTAWPRADTVPSNDIDCLWLEGPVEFAPTQPQKGVVIGI